jgi:hypothetical protein
MDNNVDTFVSFTGATTEVARRYLGMTDNNTEQAIQLFFDSPDLASSVSQGPEPAPPVPTATRPHIGASGVRQDEQDVVQIDSGDDDVDFDDEQRASSRAQAVGRAADYEDDEAIARRMQEELYAGGDAAGGYNADGVRAPMERRTETLVGGPGGDWPPEDMNAAILQQMRSRQQQRSTTGESAPVLYIRYANTALGRLGVFNQRPVPSIWDESSDPTSRREALAEATGGASEQSSKAARLAELFRPPFELMNQIPWDEAREKGKDELKWLLVNVQDPSIFHCQQLNRDIWKHEGIRELVKENFIFMQYSKDDPRGNQYTQYYFSMRDDDSAYPHIAIVDPRTGEQVKIWSGPPVPVAGEFLMQLVEFLDRYSLDVAKKNPVAKRKPEKPKSSEIDKLSEEEMLDLAVQNSLATSGNTRPKGIDPDELTKSFGDIGKGKEKATMESEEPPNGNASSPLSLPFSQISSNNHYTPPPPGPTVTRMQFKFPAGRPIIQSFDLDAPVRHIYEWLKSEPIEGKEGVEFELKSMGKDLIEQLDETVGAAGLKNSTIMVEFIEE